MSMGFDAFAEVAAVRLRHALVAAYGVDVGGDAAAEAMAYGFEHWDELAEMQNPSGYLYRVGQTAAGRLRRRAPRLPPPDPVLLPDVEPSLVPALEQLSEQQRTVVLFGGGFAVASERSRRTVGRECVDGAYPSRAWHDPVAFTDGRCGSWLNLTSSSGRTRPG